MVADYNGIEYGLSSAGRPGYELRPALSSCRAVKAMGNVIVHDGGSSFVRIQFCPWCGAGLEQAESGWRLLASAEVL